MRDSWHPELFHPNHKKINWTQIYKQIRQLKCLQQKHSYIPIVTDWQSSVSPQNCILKARAAVSIDGFACPVLSCW